MQKRFSGGRLVFDTAGKRAVKMMVKTWIKEAGITSISDCFYVEDIQADIGSWLPGASVSSKGYMLGYHDLKEPSVSGFFRLMARIGDGVMNQDIVRIGSLDKTMRQTIDDRFAWRVVNANASLIKLIDSEAGDEDE